MQTLLKLYFYDPRMCACEEREILIRYDSARTIASLDDTLAGQIKRLWKTWRGR